MTRVGRSATPGGIPPVTAVARTVKWTWVALSRTQRLRRTDAPLASLQIGPEEYFVLTRVEGRPSVGELLGGTGLPPAHAERILERLVELGALAVVEEGDAALPRTTPLGTHLRKRADTRKRELLARHLDPTTDLRARATTVRLDPPPEAPPSLERPPMSGPPAPVPVPTPEPVVPPVSAGAPRIDPRCAVPVGDQRLLLALDDRLEDLTPFEVLGLHPTDDEREIKRAYFDASRLLHPDTYFGRDLRAYGPILTRLFARAKQAYAELRRPEVRRPYVEVVLAETRRREAEAAAIAEKERARERAREEAEAEARRQKIDERRRERARAGEQRLRTKLDAQLEENLAAAIEARAAGNLARAANFFRLALQSDPHNEEIRARWEETRTLARKERAKVAFSRALQFAEYGQSNEAIPLFTEAADADPTTDHLAHAAEAVRGTEPLRARTYALEALGALNVETASKTTRDPTSIARLRIMIARAFAAAGQTKTALEQAQLAEAALPGDPEVRSLLKSLKVK
jgi:curved DNA-binding protein CbpA